MNLIFQLFLATAILVGVQPIDKDLQLDKDSAIFLFTYDGYFTKIDPANDGNILWSTSIINGSGSLISSSTTNNILQLDPSVWLVLPLQSDYVLQYGHDYNTITPQLVDKLKISSLKRLVEQKLIYLVYMSSESGDVHSWRQHSDFAMRKTDVKESIIIELEVRLVNSDELDDSVGDKLSWKFKRSQITKIQHKKHDNKEKERFKNFKKENRIVFFQFENNLICGQNTDADPKIWKKHFSSPIVAAWGFVEGQFQDLNLLSIESMSEFLLLVKHKEEIYIQPSSLMKENFHKNPFKSLNINEKMPNLSSTHFNYNILTVFYPWSLREINPLGLLLAIVFLLIFVVALVFYIKYLRKFHLEKNYDQFKILGSGSFGKVLKARHIIENKFYALKCISCGTKYELSQRTRLEVQALPRLDHPNIVKYYDSWDEEKPQIEELGDSSKSASYCMFIKMELCEDILSSWLRDSPRYDSENVLKQILKGVGYIHKEGYIHRDLKPGNIFLTITNSISVKIGDFGLAIKYNDNHVSYAVGTLLYMAPELIDGTKAKIYTYKVDVFSLGLILFETVHPLNKNRIELIEQAKKRKFPNMFYETNKAEVISSMLKEEPCNRPSIEEVSIAMYGCRTEEL